MYRVSLDKTENQQAQFKKARDELKARVDKGEQDLIIRPTVISKLPDSDSNLAFIQNTRSIRRKLHLIQNSLYQFSTVPDVIVLTETWLYPTITDSEIGLHDYNSFGGGVLVAVKKHILSTLFTCTGISCDQLFIKLHLSTNTKIVIGSVYLPPRSPIIAYEEHLHTALTVHNGNEDFNLPKIVWNNSPVLRYNLLPLSKEDCRMC